MQSKQVSVNQHDSLNFVRFFHEIHVYTNNVCLCYVPEQYPVYLMQFSGIIRLEVGHFSHTVMVRQKTRRVADKRVVISIHKPTIHTTQYNGFSVKQSSTVAEPRVMFTQLCDISSRLCNAMLSHS